MARVEPSEITEHGHNRTDNYRWLEDGENPEVIAYLEAENAYTSAAMAHTKPLQETLLEEIQGRNLETNLSVPVRVGDYFYYNRREEGKAYPIHARKRGSLDAPE
ncbi:MAG: oligopeptidase B, partial [Gemmatimonadota bacterium]